MAPSRFLSLNTGARRSFFGGAGRKRINQLSTREKMWAMVRLTDAWFSFLPSLKRLLARQTKQTSFKGRNVGPLITLPILVSRSSSRSNFLKKRRGWPTKIVSQGRWQVPEYQTRLNVGNLSGGWERNLSSHPRPWWTLSSKGPTNQPYLLFPNVGWFPKTGSLKRRFGGSSVFLFHPRDINSCSAINRLLERYPRPNRKRKC